MKLVKFRDESGSAQVARLEDETLIPLEGDGGTPCRLFDLFESSNPVAEVERRTARSERLELAQAELLAPLDEQEVWAAGVTYKRSKSARMEESEAAASCYDRVYESAAPRIVPQGYAESRFGSGPAGTHS